MFNQRLRSWFVLFLITALLFQTSGLAWAGATEPGISLSKSQFVEGYSPTVVTATANSSIFDGSIVVVQVITPGVTDTVVNSVTISGTQSAEGQVSFTLGSGLTQGNYQFRFLKQVGETTVKYHKDFSVVKPSISLSRTSIPSTYSTAVSIIVTGLYTNFDNTSSISLYKVVDATETLQSAALSSIQTVNSTTSMDVRISTGLTAGNYKLSIATPGQQTVSSTFQIVTPSIQSISPSSITNSSSTAATITVVGLNTSFANSVSRVDLMKDGVITGTTADVSVTSATQLSFQILNPNTLATGTYSIVITTDQEVVSTNLTVNAATASMFEADGITAFAQLPESYGSAKSVIVKGQNITFTNATTVTMVNTGTLENKSTSVSIVPSSASGSQIALTIATGLGAGSYKIELTTGNTVVSVNFTVTTPTLSVAFVGGSTFTKDFRSLKDVNLSTNLDYFTTETEILVKKASATVDGFSKAYTFGNATASTLKLGNLSGDLEDGTYSICAKNGTVTICSANTFVLTSPSAILNQYTVSSAALSTTILQVTGTNTNFDSVTSVSVLDSSNSATAAGSVTVTSATELQFTLTAGLAGGNYKVQITTIKNNIVNEVVLIDNLLITSLSATPVSFEEGYVTDTSIVNITSTEAGKWPAKPIVKITNGASTIVVDGNLVSRVSDQEITVKIPSGYTATTLANGTLTARTLTLEIGTSDKLTVSITPDATAPTAPNDFASTVQTGTSVSLSWTGGTDAVGVSEYEVYRNDVKVASTAGTTYTNTGLQQATSYSFKVRSKDAAGNVSAFTDAISVTTNDETAPTIPSSLTVTSKTGSTVALAWTASTDQVGVTSYEVYRGVSKIGVTSTTSYEDSGLTDGTAYSYSVRAKDAAGNVSAASTALNVTTNDVTNPSQPTGLQVVTKTGTTVSIGWTASTDNVGVTRYDVYRGDTKVGESLVASYTDTGLDQITTYQYKVRAMDAAGNISTMSGTVSATTNDSTVPSVPTNLISPYRTGDYVELSWTAATDNVAVTKYDVFRNGSKVGSTVSNAYTDTGLAQVTNYTYTIKAVDAQGNTSSSSDPLTVKTKDTTAPTKPTGLQATAKTTTSITLGWTATTDNVGVVEYKIYQGASLIGSSETTSFAVSGLSEGIQYSFTVKAIDAANNLSAASDGITVRTTDATAPTVPTGLVSTGQTTTSISLSWNAPSDNVGVVGYKVFRGTTEIATSVATTTYVADGLEEATEYKFTVKAIDADGNASDSSDELTVSTSDATAPSQPTELSNPIKTGTTLSLNWNASTDNVAVVGYEIYRDDVLLETIATTQYSASALTPVTTYAYKIRAKDAAGNASSFATINVTTLDTIVPTQPTLLSSTATTATTVTLTWTAATDNVGVTGYKIYRVGAATVSTASTTYVYDGLNEFTSYTFTVKAFDAFGNESDASDSITVKTNDVSAPAKVTGLQSSNVTGTSVTVSWSATTDNDDVVDYAIYNGDTLLETVSASTLTYQVNSLTPATSYTFTVKAKDAANNYSVVSDSLSVTTLDTVAPSKPAGLQSSNKTGVSLTLSWTVATDNVAVTGYEVYRNTVKIADVSSGTSYNDSGLTPATQYSYTIKAKDAAGNLSAVSDSLSVTTNDTIAPAAPTNLSSSAQTGTSITLTWTAATDNVGVDKYDIYRGATKVGTSETTTFTENGLSEITQYTYTVKAVDAAQNESVASAPLTVITADVTAPTKPSGLSASAVTTTSFTLSWTAATDNVAVTKYEVYRGGTKAGEVNSGNSFNDSGLTPATQYSYTVKAKDAAGNLSAASNALSVTTESNSSGGGGGGGGGGGSVIIIPTPEPPAIIVPTPSTTPSPTPTTSVAPSPTPTATVAPSPTPTATVAPSPTPTTTSAVDKAAEDLQKLNETISNESTEAEKQKAVETITDNIKAANEKALTEIKTEESAVKAVESNAEVLKQLDKVLEGPVSKEVEKEIVDSVLNVFDTIGSLVNDQVKSEKAAEQVLEAVNSTLEQAKSLLDNVDSQESKEKVLDAIANLTSNSAAAIEAIDDPDKVVDSVTKLVEQTADILKASGTGSAQNQIQEGLQNLAETAIKKASTVEISQEALKVEAGTVQAQLNQDILLQSAQKALNASAELQKTFEQNGIKTEVKQEIVIELPKQSDSTTDIKATLPSNALEELKSKGIDSLQVSMGNGTAISMDLANQNNSAFQIAKASGVAIAADAQAIELVSDRQNDGSYKITILANGKPIKAYNKQRALELKLNDLPQNVKDKDRLAIFKKEKNIWKSVGGKLQNGGTTIVAYISEPGEYKVMESTKAFADVKSIPVWATRAIEVMSAKGIVSDQADKFNSKQFVTRAEYLKMLIETLALKDKSAKSTLKDVKPSNWYYTYAATAQTLKIITGTNGKFNSSEQITRQEMAKMTAAALQVVMKPSTVNVDAVIAKWKDAKSIPSWAKPSIAYLQNLGVLDASNGAAFNPKQKVDRAQAATLMHRIYSMQ